MAMVLKRICNFKYIYSQPSFVVCTKCYSQKTDSVKESPLHVPVMINEVMKCFEPKSREVFIDMTFGAGGHSKVMLESVPDIKLLVLDRDPIAYSIAKKLAAEYPGQVVPLLGRFSELPELLRYHGIKKNSVDGVLLDCGCSSMQFDEAERGFSVSKNGPLDMRMDGNRFPDQPTAADVLMHVDEEDLVRILKVYGEEKKAKKIARAIVETKYTFKKLETTAELGDLVATVCSNEQRLDKLQRHAHSATKTFQALRIFVNNEINELNYGMIVAQNYLKIGGKIVTLTFHSLEDRIVKRHLKGNVIDNAINPLPLQYTDSSLWYDKEDVDSLLHSNWKPIHKHVLTPSAEEVQTNPRSRSAKLRAAIKVGDT
ncbi:probable methyltransferase-like protein 15 homolog [Periplaneta americana]|uniref:probable methyltransferase-like protein 15 homolog n=1 Tax=Periplaneta americana TaxID=6978 RepID=UPI0037E84778